MMNKSFMGIMWICDTQQKESTKKARFQGVIMIDASLRVKTSWQLEDQNVTLTDCGCQDRQHAQKENESYESGSSAQKQQQL